MSKAADKQCKKAVAKIRKTAATAKRIDPIVASFTMDGEEIQVQKSFKDWVHVEQERELLAEKHGVPYTNCGEHDRLQAVIVDNRNLIEKKKAGEKETAAQARKRKAAKAAVKEAEAKDNPLFIDGKNIGDVKQGSLKMEYAQETPEIRLRKYDEIAADMQEHDLRGQLMKDRHSREKAAWAEKDGELRQELYAVNSRQLDAFKNPPPPADPDFDIKNDDLPFGDEVFEDPLLDQIQAALGADQHNVSISVAGEIVEGEIAPLDEIGVEERSYSILSALALERDMPESEIKLVYGQEAAPTSPMAPEPSGEENAGEVADGSTEEPKKK